MILPHPAAVLLAILVAALASEAVEWGASCRGVATQYEIARAEVRDAERAYQRCLADEDSRRFRLTQRDAGVTRRDQKGEGEGEKVDHPSEPSEEESAPRARGAPPPARYAFEGRIIRLTESDFGRWKAAFREIPALSAELEAIDARLAEDGHQGEWFGKVSAWLRTKNEKLLRGAPRANGDASASAAAERLKRFKDAAAAEAA